MPAARRTGIPDRQPARPSRAVQDPYIVDDADDVQRRRLTDGSEHRVVKVFYEPDELAERLAQLGWVADLAGTSRFIYGSVTPATEIP
ncbi:MAG: hypothetical protein WCB92_31875 [Mycobacterium sp.]